MLKDIISEYTNELVVIDNIVYNKIWMSTMHE